MAHAFREYIQQGMDDRGWKQADLVRESGLSRALVSKYASDDRELLQRLPGEGTIEGIAKAFRVPTANVWQVVAKAMGLPIDALPTIVHELHEATDNELLGELRRRLGARVVSEEEFARERHKRLQATIRELTGEWADDPHAVRSEPNTVDSPNPHPKDTVDFRRFEATRATAERLVEHARQTEPTEGEYMAWWGGNDPEQFILLEMEPGRDVPRLVGMRDARTFEAQPATVFAASRVADEFVQRRAAAESASERSRAGAAATDSARNSADSVEGPVPPGQLAADQTDEATEYERRVAAEHGDDNEGR